MTVETTTDVLNTPTLNTPKTMAKQQDKCGVMNQALPQTSTE